MLRTKTVLIFLLKTVLIFGLLSLPFSFYDLSYGKFYCSISKSFLGKFQETGVAEYSLTKPASNMRFRIWNSAIRNSEGMNQVVTTNVNIRNRGYIPTILLLSLILASPLSFRRKLFSSFIGIALVTGLVMIKQWIHLLYICGQRKELSLYNFTPGEMKLVENLYSNFAIYNGSSLIFAFAVWLLVSFRQSDLEKLKS